jgi:predicted metal-dependent hydrolase
VLVHELAHLLEASHDTHFWALVRAYPQADRALGFLEGVEFGATGPRPDDEELEPGAVV